MSATSLGLRRFERTLLVAVGAMALKTAYNEGLGGVLKDLVRFLRKLPWWTAC